MSESVLYVLGCTADKLTRGKLDASVPEYGLCLGQGWSRNGTQTL
jgi:hypothetical protein